jgi:hypothetical protein
MAAGERYAEWLQGASATDLANLGYSPEQWRTIEEGHFVWGEDRKTGEVKPIPLQPDIYPETTTGDGVSPETDTKTYPDHPHGHYVAEPYREFVGEDRVSEVVDAGDAVLASNERGNARGILAYQDDSPEALAVRDAVQQGQLVHRVGDSPEQVGSGSYWAPERLDSSQARSGYGIGADRLSDPHYAVEKRFAAGEPYVTGYPIPEPETTADRVEVTSEPTNADSVTPTPRVSTIVSPRELSTFVDEESRAIAEDINSQSAEDDILDKDDLER